MAETITSFGYLAGLCGHDGDDWLKALIDAAGHLQVDLVDSGGADLGDLETLLTEIQDRLGDETSPAAGTVNKQLADLLTELEAKLETADLNIDAAKDLQVDVKTAPTTTVIPGSDEKLFGLSAIVEEKKSDLNLSAGTNSLDGTAVPSGEIHVITEVNMYYAGTVPTRAYIAAIGLAENMVIFNVESPASGRYYPEMVHVILQEDDYMQGTVVGATAGDDFFFRYAGYKLAAP